MKVLVLLWFFELEVSEVLLCERHLTNITNSQKWRRRGTYCIFSKTPKKYMKIKYKWLWALLVVFQFEIGLGLQALFQQGPGLKLFFGKGQVFGQKKFYISGIEILFGSKIFCLDLPQVRPLVLHISPHTMQSKILGQPQRMAWIRSRPDPTLIWDASTISLYISRGVKYI